MTSASADSYELVLEQLSMCVRKLQLLKDELEAGDLPAFRREMKEVRQGSTHCQATSQWLRPWDSFFSFHMQFLKACPDGFT